MIQPTTIVIEQNEISLFKTLEGLDHPCLILYSGLDAGRRFDLQPGTLLVGRLPTAQVPIEGEGVSRRHAELRVEGDVVELIDLGSANATYVNDEKISGPVRLVSGDMIRMANVVLRFHARRSLDALLHDRMYRMATIDSCTGAFNRRYFLEALKSQFWRARQTERPLSVICFDLDHFKRVNDAFGHAAGDHVLKECAATVRAEIRATDVFGRIGGEEFAILLGDTEAGPAAELAERLRRATSERVIELPPSAGVGLGPVAHCQTISIGVATLSATMEDAAALLEAADRLLYVSKRSGRNRVSTA